VTPVSRKREADASFTLGIGDRYRGPDLASTTKAECRGGPDRTGVYYVQDSNHDVYRYNNMWYMNYDGDWYRANSYNGPWVFVGYRSVPRPCTRCDGYRRGWARLPGCALRLGPVGSYSATTVIGSVRRRLYVPSGTVERGETIATAITPARQWPRPLWKRARRLHAALGDGYRGPNSASTTCRTWSHSGTRRLLCSGSDYDVYRNGKTTGI